MQTILETAYPEWEDDTPREPSALDCSHTSYHIDGLTRRDPPVGEKAKVPEKPPTGSPTTTPSPTRSKSLIPGWSYHKSSIAAASICTAITAGAIIFLVVISIKKLRRHWKRRQREKSRVSLGEGGHGQNAILLIEKKRKRESLMFSKNPSHTYVVEHNDGSVTRVFCTDSNDSKQLPDNTGYSPDQPLRPPSLSIKSEAARHLEALNSSPHGRAGAIPKQIVVMPSPVEPAISRSATTITPPEAALPVPEANRELQRIKSISVSSDESSGLRNLFRTSFSSSIHNPAESTGEGMAPSLETGPKDQNIDISSSKNDGSSTSANVFRLPSIKKTISPLFVLSGSKT